jgi:uncharacterized protein
MAEERTEGGASAPQAKFKGNKVDARTLLVLYPNRMHVVTTEGSGIGKMADLKGKRVSTWSPGSGTEVTAFRLIEAAGLDRDKDMKRERLSVAESVNAIKDGQDRRVLLGRRPADRGRHRSRRNAGRKDQNDRPGRPGRKNERQIRSALRTRCHQGRHLPRPEQGQPDRVVWNLLVASDKMPDSMAYDIVKTIFDQKADLVAVHQEAKSIDLKNQTKANSSIPCHPGAAKYLPKKRRADVIACRR